MNRKQKQLRVLGVIPGNDADTAMWFARRQMATVGAHGILARSFFLRSRTSPRRVWQEMKRLRQEIADFEPDVVHANYGTVTAFVCTLVSPVPVVITFHGQDLNPSPGVPWLRLRASHVFSRLAARQATRIVCVSSLLQDRIPQHKVRSHVIPCGINTDRFRPCPRHEARQRLGWDLDKKVVLFNAGSDPIRKRIDLAQAAFELLNKKLPDARLHIFSGSTHPDEMPYYFSAADCLLVASDYEGSPQVVKEAMACDLPVVTVEVGDVAERLSGVQPSQIVDRSPAALAQGMADILQRGIRSNGSAKMHELSEDAIAGKLAAIYRLAATAAEPRVRLNGRVAVGAAGQ